MARELLDSGEQTATLKTGANMPDPTVVAQWSVALMVVFGGALPLACIAFLVYTAFFRRP
jgi:hypothetical protein